MCKENLDRILEQEERFWKQRAKNHWLQGGDRITRSSVLAQVRGRGEIKSPSCKMIMGTGGKSAESVRDSSYSFLSPTAAT